MHEEVMTGGEHQQGGDFGILGGPVPHGGEARKDLGTPSLEEVGLGAVVVLGL